MKFKLKGNLYASGRMFLAGQELEVGKDITKEVYEKYTGAKVAEVKTTAKPKDAIEVKPKAKAKKKSKKKDS